MDATKVLDLTDGATTDFFAKLYDVTVSGQDEDVSVTHHRSSQAAGEGQIREVGGLSDSGVETLDGGRIAVVPLGSAKDEDLLAQHGSGNHLGRNRKVSSLSPFARVDVVALDAAEDLTSGRKITIVATYHIQGVTNWKKMKGETEIKKTLTTGYS